MITWTEQPKHHTICIKTKMNVFSSKKSITREEGLANYYLFLNDIKPLINSTQFYTLSMMPIFAAGTSITNNIEFTAAIMETFDLLYINDRTAEILKVFFDITRC